MDGRSHEGAAAHPQDLDEQYAPARIRPSRNRSLPSDMSAYAPQILGRSTPSSSSETSSVASARRPSSILRRWPSYKAEATCLLQPFAVLSQSWYTNSSTPSKPVPQWVLSGAELASSPRSSFDSFNSRCSIPCSEPDEPLNDDGAKAKELDSVVTLQRASTSQQARNMDGRFCEASLASWRIAVKPPRWAAIVGSIT
ncbi:unnamed protein product [Zymoseptoria tritici ST99CH_3D1]|nr:unnamed protein product [Zymoseptoria tritici ST99CH_3D1]